MADSELVTYLTRAGLSPKDAVAMLDRWDGSGPGGGGAAQTVTVLGPFTVNFDDPDVDDHGVKAFDIPADAVIVKAWIEVPSIWVGTTAVAYIFASTDEEYLDNYNWVEIARYDVKAHATVTNGLGDTLVLAEDTPIAVARAATFSEPGMVGVWLQTTGPNTQGVLDVYALIVTPA